MKQLYYQVPSLPTLVHTFVFASQFHFSIPFTNSRLNVFLYFCRPLILLVGPTLQVQYQLISLSSCIGLLESSFESKNNKVGLCSRTNHNARIEKQFWSRNCFSKFIELLFKDILYNYIKLYHAQPKLQRYSIVEDVSMFN